MNVEESSHRLHELITPLGHSFRPNWFGCLGIGNDTLFVYAYDQKEAAKFLAKHAADGKWEGFPVVVKPWSGILPLGGT